MLATLFVVPYQAMGAPEHQNCVIAAFNYKTPNNVSQRPPRLFLLPNTRALSRQLILSPFIVRCAEITYMEWDVQICIYGMCRNNFFYKIMQCSNSPDLFVTRCVLFAKKMSERVWSSRQWENVGERARLRRQRGWNLISEVSMWRTHEWLNRKFKRRSIFLTIIWKRNRG